MKPKRELKVVLTFLDPLLGSQSANPDIHKEFIASKSPDAEKVAEELAALPAEEQEAKALQVFPRSAGGRPFLWDYQIKGFFKDAAGMLNRTADKEENGDNPKLAAHKKIIDGLIFVVPRQIMLEFPEEQGLSQCTRPLRAQTKRGERVALQTSEQAPAGTRISFTIQLLKDDLEDRVVDWLEYGEFRGMGQWRNSGHGRFTFEVVV